MEGLKLLKGHHRRFLTLLFLTTIIIDAYCLNHHNRELGETIDPAIEIPITEEDTNVSSESVVVKAVDIPEEKVTYDGSQVWRVLAMDDKSQYVSYLQETGGTFFISTYNIINYNSLF